VASKATSSYGQNDNDVPVLVTDCTPTQHWNCCNTDFTDLRHFHKHVSAVHSEEITEQTDHLLTQGSEDARWSKLNANNLKRTVNGHVKSGKEDVEENSEGECHLPKHFKEEDVYQWLPRCDHLTVSDNKDGRILLFYNYR